jgi:hypothetical protein
MSFTFNVALDGSGRTPPESVDSRSSSHRPACGPASPSAAHVTRFSAPMRRFTDHIGSSARAVYGPMMDG